MWKPRKGRDDAELRARLKQLAERYPRAGYLHRKMTCLSFIVSPKLGERENWGTSECAYIEREKGVRFIFPAQERS
jgi:hypothetical protein